MLLKFHKDFTLPNSKEIFVFGSNLAGIHGAGAAKIAYDNFGAIWGNGKGLMGLSYAIPTKDKNLKSLDLSVIEKYVHEFVEFTKTNLDKHFFITRVGCGLAGYKDHQIAPLFIGAKNCSFPLEWKDFLKIENELL